jgi:opacity protein-like surface antigen
MKNIQTNKKTSFLAIFFSLFLISNNSLAKTSGSYLSIDGLSTRTSFYQKGDIDNNGQIEEYTAKPTNYGTTYGVGITYRYAFNVDGFFIAPNIFYEQNSTDSTSTNGYNDIKLRTKNRFGGKIDFGYDINDFVAPYLTIGYAGIGYKSRVSGYHDITNTDYSTADNSGIDSNFTYGAGFKFKLTDLLALNLEYNYQKFETENEVPQRAKFYLKSSEFISRVDVIKVGLSINF